MWDSERVGFVPARGAPRACLGGPDLRQLHRFASVVGGSGRLQGQKPPIRGVRAPDGLGLPTFVPSPLSNLPLSGARGQMNSSGAAPIPSVELGPGVPDRLADGVVFSLSVRALLSTGRHLSEFKGPIAYPLS